MVEYGPSEVVRRTEGVGGGEAVSQQPSVLLPQGHGLQNVRELLVPVVLAAAAGEQQLVQVEYVGRVDGHFGQRWTGLGALWRLEEEGIASGEGGDHAGQ
eukprot:CAMPEP_0201096220 /NCGR_PEP_ID=MMETSP0812-20130820/5213_1 /ASSEMBLY_ACC=CAM_ASM_000668 /TAXON_ID=98059 /ORGANISM="Dinobryon sp., Strain UTEXLB2267" /LENGTH=99 /DNA_ID=CAMNT_0047350371 /DNA_START=115 /DNA_END=415 /DNA_ORIENTATION=+